MSAQSFNYVNSVIQLCLLSHLKRIISTNCCIRRVVPSDDGPRYARNMYRLTKYTKNMSCIKLVFFTLLYRYARSTKHNKFHTRNIGGKSGVKPLNSSALVKSRGSVL